MRLILTMAAVAGAIVLTAFAASGCQATTARGTNYVLKVDRELQAYLDAPLETTHGVAREVLQDEFLYLVTAEGLDGREGFIEARSAKGRYVRVETYRIDDALTEVEIFVTPFGVFSMQVDILSRIEESLGVAARMP